MFLEQFLRTITTWENYYYTLYLFLTTTTYGVIFTYFPNITVDMKYILNTNMSLISLYTTFETVGRILGTLVPLFYKYLNRQVTVSIVFSILTLSCAVLPLVPRLWLFWLCGFISGFGSSVTVCGYTVWLIEMWKNKSGPILQVCEFGFGIGSIMATLILKPYLVGEISLPAEDGGDNALLLTNIMMATDTDPAEIDRRGRLMWPSLIAGACILPIPISSLIMYFIKPYKTPEILTKHTTDENSNTNTDDMLLFDRPEAPGKLFRALCALWYTAYVIFESMFLKFAVTYFQYCPLKLSAQTAAEIFWISTAVFTAFRGINVFIALKFKTVYIISYHYFIILIGMVLLVIGQHYLTVMWTASIILNWGFSFMFAGLFSFIGELLTMTNTLSTMFVLIRALFTLVTPLIIGLYIETYSMIFIIVLAFYLIASIICYAIILYLLRYYSKLLMTKKSEN